MRTRRAIPEREAGRQGVGGRGKECGVKKEKEKRKLKKKKGSENREKKNRNIKKRERLSLIHI